MVRKGYVIHDQQAVYYLTFTVVGWIDIFSRQSYIQARVCRAKAYSAKATHIFVKLIKQGLMAAL